MKVKAIYSCGRANVYNMEVDDTHDYAVENGAILHNCRYVAMENPISPRLPAAREFKPLNPLESSRPYVRVYR